MRTVLETSVPGPVPHLRHPEWHERLPWLVQGTTERGRDSDPFDLGVFGPGDSAAIRNRWRELTRAHDAGESVLAHQVHGTRIVTHAGAAGSATRFQPVLAGDADGHATAAPGLILAVTVADCVPVTVVDGRRRVVALVHAGWRGLADGIVEEAVDVLTSEFGSELGDLLLHAGPAICGQCYEVGPEVHQALGLDVPPGPEPVDLRAEIGRRAVARGVSEANVTGSGHCTLGGPGSFFSHRGGDVERQVGFVGIRH